MSRLKVNNNIIISGGISTFSVEADFILLSN